MIHGFIRTLTLAIFFFIATLFVLLTSNQQPIFSMIRTLLPLFFTILFLVANAQDNKVTFLIPSDTLNKTRFWSCAIGTTAAYAGATYGLYNVWYKQYELTSFHTFDDSREWKNMDKTGHLLTTYTQARIVYGGARWTGVSKNKAIWTGVGVGMLLQSSLEVMDGYSAKWGFSWSDMGFNALGAAMFAAQQHFWDEQRFLLKISSPPLKYPSTPVYSIDGNSVTTPAIRATELFGTNYGELFLKDYNSLTLWLSFSPNLFLKKDNRFFPEWLNLSIGYSAQNLYGGYENRWTNEEGATFQLPLDEFPRYRQGYLSLDIDLTKIKTRNRFLKTLFYTFNFIKIPSPALEINGLGKVKFQPLRW
jgi:hypothetical protein